MLASSRLLWFWLPLWICASLLFRNLSILWTLHQQQYPNILENVDVNKEEKDTTTTLHLPLESRHNDNNNNNNHNEKKRNEDPALSFSACLIVMDENHRLTEWIAYHYFMLPLRHLVVLVDPASQTSPRPILQRWNDLMTIEIWSDATIQYQPPVVEVDTLQQQQDRKRTFTHAHFDRQKLFYQKCAVHLRSLSRNWTAFIDVDEFLYLDPQLVPDAISRMQTPGSVLDFVQQGQEEQTQEPPPKPCIMVARTFFGATEAPPNQTRGYFPSYLNASHQWDTLRYVYRVGHENVNLNGRAKSLVHVSRPPSPLPFNDRGIHSILQKPWCRPPPWHNSPIRIRHYLGSWSAHSSRVNDPRRGTWARNWEYYHYRAGLGHERDASVQGWLRGFCELLQHNQSRIEYLLQGAGEVPLSIRSTVRNNQVEWSLPRVEIQKEIQRSGNKPGSFGSWLKKYHSNAL